MHFWKLIPAQILCRVRKSPYVRHPVCQMVSDVALAIVRYAINLGPVGCTLNVDGLPLPLFMPLFFPSDQLMCDVFDLLSPTSQPLPHLRSSEMRATGTVCLAARHLSVPSVQLSLPRPHSMFHKSL